MKNFIFCLVVAVFISSGLSYADVYVMHKGEEIIGLSEQKDMVLQPGAEITVIKGTLSDVSLSRPLDEYKFQSKKFKVDATKVKAKEDAQLAEDQKKANKAVKKQSAIDKLKALGLTEDEINAISNKE